MNLFARGLGVVLAGAVLSAGCAGPAGGSGSAAQIAPGGGPLKRIALAIRGEPTSLSSRIDGIGAGSTPGVGEVERLINGGFAITDQEGALRPQLAKDVPTVDNGLWRLFPDGRMEVTWNIREGVRWHDGAPFTSADAAFTVEVERDPALEVLRDPAYRSLDRVEAPDPLTVTAVWREPFIKADTMFNHFALPMPKHLLEEAYRTQPETFIELPYWNAGYIGTGPFRVKEWTPSVRAVLTKNPDYVLGAPRIDEIEVKFIADPGTLGANVLAGQVDLTVGGRLALDWGIQIRDQWRDGRMIARAGNQMSAWPQFLNPSPAVLTNVQFRRALLHAVDRQEMSDSLVAGLSPVADSVVSPQDAEYRSIESSIRRYPFDPQRAVQMIASLGYIRGANGMFQGPEGPLRVEVRTRSNDEMQVKTTLALADYWEKAGVGVDQVHFAAQQANDREWRAVRPAFEVVRQPSGVDSFQRYLGSATPLPENRFSGENRTRYQNPELDSLIHRYLTTIPMAERMSYAAQIIRILTDQVVIMTLFYDVIPTLVSNRLTNGEGFGATSPGVATWDAHLWEVR